VNITAGEGLSLGEFQDVGDTIEEFACDNATIVVGTVIDETMGDSIKVTVVATGLGSNAETAPAAPVVQQPQSVTPAPITAPADAGDVISRQPVDYSGYDKPIGTRSPTSTQRLKSVAGSSSLATKSTDDVELLDIPAFLRRQAD
jgi:cell division protein FtsZ